MALNLISSIVVFIIQALINFFLAPFIIGTLGDEAYGFLGLANSIVSYGYILTVVINSVAGRFIAYEYHRGQKLRASKYYSSTLVINFVFSLAVCVLSAAFISNLNYFINVSPALYTDVRLTLAIYFANFCLGLFNAVLTCHAFIKNKIYLITVRNAISTALFASCVLALYYFLPARIFYAAISALAGTIFVFFSALAVNRRLATGVKFRLKLFRANMLGELLRSGSWNSFNMISYTLINSVDLLLCNIFIGAAAMGVLSVSKAAILIIEAFVYMLSSTFAPRFVELFSKGAIADLLAEVKFAMKAEAFLALAPVCVFVALGRDFYALWLPFKDAGQIDEIYALAMISTAPAVALTCMYPLLNLNVVANKLRRPAIANMIMALAAVGSQIVLLALYNLGLYALVASMAACMIARVALFDVFNAARNLSAPLGEFLGVFGRNLLFFAALVALMIWLRTLVQIGSWSSFALWGAAFLLLGYALSLLMIFSASERVMLANKLKTMILRGRK